MTVHLNIVDRTPGINKFLVTTEDGASSFITLILPDGSTKGQILDVFWETYPDVKNRPVSFPYQSNYFENDVILECEVGRADYPFAANCDVKWITHPDFNAARESYSAIFCKMMASN